MLSHQNEEHQGTTPNYKMKVEKVFKDPLSRQAGEAVMIRRTKGNVLNSKLEFNQPQLFNVRREIMNGWETAQKPDVFLMNVYMYRRSEHQSSNLKSNSYQLVTWRGQQAKDLVKKFKLFAIKALEINYQVTRNYCSFLSSQLQGHFILDASFNDNNNFELYPNIGTEVGVCKTINPMVRNISRLIPSWIILLC